MCKFWFPIILISVKENTKVIPHLSVHQRTSLHMLFIRLIKVIVHEYLNVADFGVLQSYSEKKTAKPLIWNYLILP